MSVPSSFAGLPLVGEGAAPSTGTPAHDLWTAPEGIAIKTSYGPDDLEGLDEDEVRRVMRENARALLV